MKEKINKIGKLQLTTILLIVICALLGIGLISYAAFSINLTGQSNIISKAPNISLTYEEPPTELEVNGLSYNMEEGKRLSNYFEFTITGTSPIDYYMPYIIYLTEETGNTLSKENIYLYLTEVVDGVETAYVGPVKLSELNSYSKHDNSIYIFGDNFDFADSINRIERTYRLRLWPTIDNVDTTIEDDGSQSINISGGTFAWTVSVETNETPETCFGATFDDATMTATINGYDAVSCGTDVVIPNRVHMVTYSLVENPTQEAISNCIIAYKEVISEEFATTLCNGGEVNSLTLETFFSDPSSALEHGSLLANTGMVEQTMSEEQYVVTTIGSYAFQNNNLTSVVLPDSVTSIGTSAFYNNNLTSVFIPNGVTTMGDGAFWGNNLTSIIVDSNNKKYDSRNNSNAIIETATNKLLLGCKNTIIPNSVKTIGNYAFYYTDLTSVTIPDSVTTIGDYAFEHSNLTNVTIPDSVTIIGNDAFAHNNLTSLTLGNSVTTIGALAFNDNNLTSVVIPDSVTTIGEGAFEDNNLSYVVIGANSNLTETTGIKTSAFLTYNTSNPSNPNLTIIYNNSGKAFDFNAAITGTAGTPFIEGTVPSYDDKIVTITTGTP